MSLANPVRTRLSVVVAGGVIGAYVAAANFPTGWWATADFGSGSARILGGMGFGAITAWIIGRSVART